MCSDQSKDFLGCFNLGPRLLDCPPARPRIQTQLETIEGSQKMDDIDAEINASHNKEENNQNVKLAPDTSRSELPFHMLMTLLSILS